jgi:heme-degrading monooxygenase HmoA
VDERWRARSACPGEHRAIHRLGNAGTQQQVRHLRRAGRCRVPAGQSRHGLSVYACAVAEPYTSTTWIVKPGQEDEFVRRWTEFAEWSAGQGLAAPAMLLRDVDEPTRFVSFGPWEDIQMIWRWRGLTGFQERVASLNEVLVSFEPRTLELVGGRRRRGRLKRS